MPRPTSAERGRQAHVQRRRLIRALGGRCRLCRTRRRLEFDHVQRRTWVARKVNRWQRIRLYQREAARGLIRVLCRSCNARRNRRRA